VATLSGTITPSFKSGTAFSWIATGYLISNAACQPLSGKLTDIYGRRAGLVVALLLFTTGTLLCGFANNAATMIAGRVIAGMGGGCLNTISTFVLSDLVPLKDRGVWQGIGSIIYGAGTGLGGIFGGFVHEKMHWSYAFIIQVPFIVLAGTCSVVFLRIPPKDKDLVNIKRVDFLGAVTLVTSLSLLMIGLNSGGNTVPWSHPLVYSSLIAGVVFLALFVMIEDRISIEPVIPVRLLLNQGVAAACLTCWFNTMAMFSLLFFIPIYFNVVVGLSAAQAGSLFVPQAIGTAVGSLGTGIIMSRTGRYYWLHQGTQCLMVFASAVILITFGTSVSAKTPFICLALAGISYGSMLTIVLIALISAVDYKWHAVITSALFAFRSTGSSIGISVCSAIFQTKINQELFDHFGGLLDAENIINRIRDSVDEIQNAPVEWHSGIVESYVEALRGVWVAVLLFTILAAGASMFLKGQPLHKKSSGK